MAQQTAVMKLFAWMTEQGYQVEYEMEMSFLDIEKEQMYQVWKTSEEWSDGKLLDSKKSFEEYYKETYGK